MGYKIAKTPAQAFYEIPLFGDQLQKIGHIIEIYNSPCSPDAEIWVYGLFQAVPTLWATLTKPQTVDINIRHGHGKPRKGIAGRFVSEYIFRDAVIEIPVPRSVVFRVWEMGQRIQWFFMVGDVTEDFAINWMSAAYTMEGCKLPFLHYARYKTLTDNVINGVAGGRASMGMTLVEVSGLVAGPNTFELNVQGRFRVTWSVTFDFDYIVGPQAKPDQVFLWDHGLQKAVDGGAVTQGPTGKPIQTWSAFFENGSGSGPFSLQGSFSETGFCHCVGTMSVDETLDSQLGPDP